MLIDCVLPGSLSQLEVQLLPDWLVAGRALTSLVSWLTPIRDSVRSGLSVLEDSLTCETEMTKYALLNKDRFTRQNNKIHQEQYHVKKTNTRYVSPLIALVSVFIKLLWNPNYIFGQMRLIEDMESQSSQWKYNASKMLTGLEYCFVKSIWVKLRVNIYNDMKNVIQNVTLQV